MRIGMLGACVAGAVAMLASPVASQGQVVLRSEQVASGLSQPLGVFAIPGDTGRLFVVE